MDNILKGLPEKRFFRIDEVAAYFSVSHRTIRRWIDEGKLHHAKILCTIRIPREAILEIISFSSEDLMTSDDI